MGFKFTFLCDLLSSLEESRVLKASTQAKTRNPDVQIVKQWFAQHANRLHGSSTDPAALLSCMFPEKRTDRVYGLQDTNLARVIGRCLLLGSSRREELERWRISGGPDLGQCVENVMRQTENHIISGQEVTLEEIDFALGNVASRCRFSGPRVRRQRTAVDVEETLSPLYRRLSSRDAKWLTRMILKSYFSVVLPESLLLRCFHFLLPHLLLFQDSFEAALKLLSSSPIAHFPPHPEPRLAKGLGLIALQYLTPNIGIKIGRPDYYKARSIKHCCQMISQRRMSVERKYDGEYCQVHVDLSKHPTSIQIFSKSGKDSTADRSGILQTIRDSLKLGKQGSKVLRQCILEGELVVWSEKHQKILDFYKLRKFVSRSGVYIGTENDSPPQPYEHLMIVFFDILLLDEDVCLRKPHRERRLLLKNTLHLIPGRADIVHQRVIDFSHPDGQSRLESIFSMGIAERWEGFVLKGCEDPYFSVLTDAEDEYFGRWIKLKKDYIPGLGDTVDLALVGAAYNARDAASLDLTNEVSWTHFFVGCLLNKEAISQPGKKPKFRIVDAINRHSMSKQNMHLLNQLGKYSSCQMDSCPGFDIECGRSSIPPMDVVFKTPFVVEMLGSGFEKPSGVRFYTLRFPRILKIHLDRPFEDAATFTELQLLAEAAISVSPGELAEEEMEWTKRLRPDKSKSEYLLHNSQSLVSTESSSGPSETDIFTGAAVSIDSGSIPGDAVPIYVDPVTSMSSSDEFTGPESDFLASNENLSSRQNSRKRKASLSTDQSCNDSVSQNKTQGPQMRHTSNNLDASKLPFPVSTEAGGSTSISHNQKLCDVTCNKDAESIEFPLSTIPLYVSWNSCPEKYKKRVKIFSNTTSNLDQFLCMLWSEDPQLCLQRSNHETTIEPVVLGIFLTDCCKNPLGQELLEISKRISEKLRVRASKYPLRGQIFLVNFKFLSLYETLRDAKLCLRETWENSGRYYFYACVMWNPDTGASDPIDEIPGTPVYCVSSTFGHDMIPRHNLLPKITITFDRNEVLPLA